MSRFVAAEKLNHNINFRACDQCVGVPGDQLRGQTQLRIGLETAVGDAGEFDPRAELGGQHRGVAAQQLDDSAADRTAAEQTDPDRFHRILPAGGC